jgi:peptidoglycan-N-acetylglucosamine deacetylase
MVGGGALAVAVLGGVAALTLLRSGDSAAIVTHGPRDRSRVALTFDADMTPAMLVRVRSGVEKAYDPEIVRELRAARVPATIFLTGLWAAHYRDVVRGLARDPLFELENHSMDHAGFTTSCFGLARVGTEDRKRWEVAAAAEVISEITRLKQRFFRFPGGCHSSADLRLVRSLGHEAVGWDVVSGDSYQPDPAVVERNVLANVRPGSIVVLHLNGFPNAPATADALPTVISSLRSRGYELVTLHELLEPSY